MVLYLSSQREPLKSKKVNIAGWSSLVARRAPVSYTHLNTSNFFELAAAVAIALFGTTSPAALATTVGVLTEVPVMPVSYTHLDVYKRQPTHYQKNTNAAIRDSRDAIYETPYKTKNLCLLYTSSCHTDDRCDGRSNHAADKREVEFQVDAEHSGLGNAEVAGDAGGNVDFLCGSILALQIDHTEDGGALRNVGQRDHRPQHRTAEVGNQLHIDGVGHVMQAGDDQRGINKTEDCAKDHAEGTGNAGVDDVRNEGADLPADGAKDSVGDDDGQHQRAEGHNEIIEMTGGQILRKNFSR